MLMGIIGGPTAVGKSALALRLCRKNGFSLIAADSRQLYAGLKIGTGAPTPQEQTEVEHYLVGDLPVGQPFSPLRFREEALRILDQLGAKPSLIVGGTGLYLRELLYPTRTDVGNAPPEIAAAAQAELKEGGAEGLYAKLKQLDPAGMIGIHVNDHYRLRKRLEHWMMTGTSYATHTPSRLRDPRFNEVTLLLLDSPREELHALIAKRVRAMVAAGWPREAQALFERNSPDTLGLDAIGYSEMAAVAEGKLPLEKAITRVISLTKHYAKKQSTFFRHQFPEGESWDVASLEKALQEVDFDWQRFRASRRQEGFSN